MKSGRSFLSLIGLSLIAFAVTAGFALSPPNSAAEKAEENSTGDLRKAFRALSAGDLAAAGPLFHLVQKDPDLASWGLVGEALTFEALGKKDEALAAVQKIPENDAASTDATLIRTVVQPTSPLPYSVESWRSLLELRGREDLIPKLLVIATGESIRRKDGKQALTYYRDLRPLLFKHPALPLGGFRPSAENLFANLLPLLDASNRDAALLFEAQQSFASRDIDRTLTLLSSRNAEGPAAAILRAKALRSSGKSEEAVACLIRAAKESNQREELLLELVRLLWNENRLAETRKYAAEFVQLFPKSAAANEVRHSAALSWISGGDWPRGIRELEKVAAMHPRSEFQALSQRALAWLAFRKGELGNAVHWLKEYRESSADRLEKAKSEPSAPERSKQLRDAKFELEHSTYWLAAACLRLASGKQPEICRKHPPHALFESLVKDSPISYYGMLAALRLERPFPPPEYLAADQENSGYCKGSLPATFERRLSAIQREELPALVHIELANYLQSTATDACRLSLFNRFGDAPAGLRLADSILKGAPAIPSGAPMRTLITAAFPLPYRDAYERETAEKSVPLPFALAITRTESHFDPDARSTSDARGLMQLLPKTARGEGLEDPELLFQAETNIRVGVQHIAGLFRHLHGNEDLVAGAYNGGRDAVLRWKSRSTPHKPHASNDYETLGIDAWIETIPYGETRNYIKKVRIAKQWYTALAVR